MERAMMHRTGRLLLAASLAAVCAWAFATAHPILATAGPNCRRVKLSGSVTVTPKPRPGFRGTIIAAEGKFTMDLIFPEQGGGVRHQQSTVALTRIRSYSYGGAHQCRITLPASAQTPRPFTVWANLEVDAVVAEDGAGKVKSVADQFDMLVRTLPAFEPATYKVICDGGRPGQASDYGMSHAQLVQVFSRTQYSGSVKLNRMGDTRQLPDVDLFGSMTGNAEWEVLETLVPCANFQYQ
jgi:hypothetical protein